MAWLPKSDLDSGAIRTMKRALTIKPKQFRSYGDDDAPKGPVPCWVETADEFGIPRAYFFKTSQHQHDLDWEVHEGVSLPEMPCLLRQVGAYAEQATALDAIQEHFRPALENESDDTDVEAGIAMSGILRGTTGFGKTATALALIHRLGRRAVVVVHKEFLQRQWVDRIRKFLPEAKVGIVQADTCEWDSDIVIAMAQSLAKEDGTRYPRELYESPGILIVDETHRLGATTWSPIPTLFPSMFRLGLTATPRRKDGCDKVFWWHLGGVIYAAQTETPKPAVRMVSYRGGSKIEVLQKEHISPAITTNVLVRLTRRNDLIIDEIEAALRSPQGRKVMVLSERLDHLRKLDELLAERTKGRDDVTTGFYVGAWFTGNKTFTLKGRKKLGDDREQGIATIYRHFRRTKIEVNESTYDLLVRLDEQDEEPVGGKKRKATAVWRHRCGRSVPFDEKREKREVLLYEHEYALRTLEDLDDKQLCQLAKDYGIAQDKARDETAPRSEEELHEAERARVIWATYQMCSEGVDIPAVDTLGFATPVSDVEQAYGRGRRYCTPKKHGGEMSPKECDHYCPWRASECSGKPDGVAFDIVDVNVPMGRKRRKYRLRFYESIGTKVAGAGTT